MSPRTMKCWAVAAAALIATTAMVAASPAEETAAKAPALVAQIKVLPDTAPDFSSGRVLNSFAATENVKCADRSLVPAESGKPGVVVVDFSSPYLLTKASGEAAGADAVEVSTDGGKTFKAVELKDFTEAVRGQVAAEVRITFKGALKALKLEAIVQNNSGALPYLSPGKNVVTVSVAHPKALANNKLVVTYAEK